MRPQLLDLALGRSDRGVCLGDGVVGFLRPLDDVDLGVERLARAARQDGRSPQDLVDARAEE